MALTKGDLKAIDSMLVKRVNEIVVKRVDEIVTKRLEPVNKRLTKIEKDLKTTINFFDKEHLGLKKRVEKIEYKLKIPAGV